MEYYTVSIPAYAPEEFDTLKEALKHANDILKDWKGILNKEDITIMRHWTEVIDF